MIDDDDDDDEEREEAEEKGRKKAGKIRLILSTCPEDKAEELARHLVEGRYAACVNIVPLVRSIYRWQGRVETQAESLLVAKCAKRAAKRAMEALREKHPYEVPEIIGLTVKGGNPDYFDWVSANSEAP